MNKDIPPPAGFKVQPSPVVPVIVNILRQIGLVIAGGTTMIVLARNFWGTGSVEEAIIWVQSQDFAIFMAAATFVFASVSSIWRTLRNEWIKRSLAAAVPNRVARVEAHGVGALVLKLLAMLGLVTLSGCMTISGGSPVQKLFEARANYVVLKGAMVDYAESPTADASAVRALVRIRDQAQPSVDYVDAYGACGGKAVGQAYLEGRAEPIDCATFNFSAASVSSATIALRAAVAGILTKLGRN